MFAIIVLSDRCWLRCYCTNATHSSMALMLQPKTASHSVVIVVIATIVISRKGGCGGRFTYIPGSILAGDLEFEGGRLDIGL